MAVIRDYHEFETHAAIPTPVSTIVASLLKNWDNVGDEGHAYLATLAPDAILEFPPYTLTDYEQIRGMRGATIHPQNGPTTGIQHRFGNLYILAGDSLSEPSRINFTGTVEYVIGGKVYSEGFSTTFDFVKDVNGVVKGKHARINMNMNALTNAMMSLAPSGTG